MKAYEFNISDGTKRYLQTEEEIEKIKERISDSKWISLARRFRDKKREDIQTCAIISVARDEHYEKIEAQLAEEDKRKMVIIAKIRDLPLDKKAKKRIQKMEKRVRMDVDVSEGEDLLMGFGEEYLQDTLDFAQKRQKSGK